MTDTCPSNHSRASTSSFSSVASVRELLDFQYLNSTCRSFQSFGQNRVFLLEIFRFCLNFHIRRDPDDFETGAIQKQILPLWDAGTGAVSQVEYLGISRRAAGLLANRHTSGDLLHHQHERFTTAQGSAAGEDDDF